MKSFMTNWKTTGGGALTALLGIASLMGVKIAGAAPVDPQVAIGMIIAGGTMIFAKDGNVTGGDVKQD